MFLKCVIDFPLLTPKSLAAAKLNGLEIHLAGPPDFKFGETNKSEAFRTKFPLGMFYLMAHSISLI